jgi:dolichol kinase
VTGSAIRRLAHASSALLLLVVPLAGWSVLAIVVSAGVVGGWILEVARLRSAQVHAVLSGVLPVFRAVEARRPCGAAWLGAGYILAVWLPPPAPAAAILVAALADPAASLVGNRFSTPEAGAKTVGGSAAHFAVACAVLAALAYSWWLVLGVAALATAFERWSAPLDDNLVVPPAVALGVTLLG